MTARNILRAIALCAGLQTMGQGKGDTKMDSRTVPAIACDHRYGAQATWSQSTDASQLNSFYWAEACAFRENLALTVFDNSFAQGRAYVTVPERQEAAKSGRLSFQVYFLSDTWMNPKTGKPTRIPDYYGKVWTKAGVAAGFKVVPGEAKTTRTPNHGQQMFDVSGGRFGHDVKNGKPGREDVLTGLIEYQTNWVRTNFGACSAAGYRNGQTGASYAMPAHLLGVRNSGHNGDLSYGRSPRDKAILGTGRYPDLTPKDTASFVLTTRAGDIDKPREALAAYCGKLLQEAIAKRGWYRDFNHWHTSPRFGLSLEHFLADQRKTIGNHDVVSLGFGSALQHKFLRDMATVSARETPQGVRLNVEFRDPYGSLPLATLRIPLSVRVELAKTSLAGKDVASPEGCAIRRLPNDVVVVDIPFPGREGTVSVHLEATDTPNYMDLAKPRVLRTAFQNGSLLVTTDKPTRVVVFASPKGKGLRGVRPMARVHEPSTKHTIPLQPKPGHDLYVGAITERHQSSLVGPLPATK
ncbi:MAG: hypothetical protein HN849_16140 [Victivallales bacterium]|jgi:hypothetical protein|nr:hypothetical protein [Victivallales bacterium]